jgi:two-component system cell cycle sensor histidine kinase/response regulator CckA
MGSPLRALFVEDSEDDAALLALELRRGGFDVIHQRVDTSSALISALETGDWDVVISDYSMPGFSGAEALTLVRAKNSEVPFLYVSGTIGEDIAVAALRSGAQDYLVKGNLKRLVSAIQREIRDREGRLERQRLERQVDQLQRFEAIGRLAGGIAHDFNNVIGAIMGWAEIGCQELPEGHKTRERLQRIQIQAERASGLTRQLLAFARRQVLEPQNVDLNALITETVSLLGKVIGAQVRIELELAPDLLPIWADATQIEQVVMNLCLNARDAMPQGGQIRIQTREAELHAGAGPLGSHVRPGKYAFLSIADTGVGMDAATLSHVFEPFFTTKQVGKGTGLGLATVYGVVKQHGGIIEVESEPGCGSTFQIHLPTGSGAIQLRDQRPEGQLKGGTETVLIAEDHDGMRETAKEMLDALGYNVLLTTNGKRAVELFRDKHASIDLLILDVAMPEMGGPAAFEAMTAIKPDVRVIFTTGYSSEIEALRALVRKGVSIIQKPYNSQALGRRIRAVLDGAI